VSFPALNDSLALRATLVPHPCGQPPRPALREEEEEEWSNNYNEQTSDPGN